MVFAVVVVLVLVMVVVVVVNVVATLVLAVAGGATTLALLSRWILLLPKDNVLIDLVPCLKCTCGASKKETSLFF